MSAPAQRSDECGPEQPFRAGAIVRQLVIRNRKGLHARACRPFLLQMRRVRTTAPSGAGDWSDMHSAPEAA